MIQYEAEWADVLRNTSYPFKWENPLPGFITGISILSNAALSITKLEPNRIEFSNRSYSIIKNIADTYKIFDSNDGLCGYVEIGDKYPTCVLVGNFPILESCISYSQAIKSINGIVQNTVTLLEGNNILIQNSIDLVPDSHNEFCNLPTYSDAIYSINGVVPDTNGNLEWVAQNLFELYKQSNGFRFGLLIPESILDCPRPGYKGPTGPEGPQGPPGAPGRDANGAVPISNTNCDNLFEIQKNAIPEWDCDELPINHSFDLVTSVLGAMTPQDDGLTLSFPVGNFFNSEHTYILKFTGFHKNDGSEYPIHATNLDILTPNTIKIKMDMADPFGCWTDPVCAPICLYSSYSFDNLVSKEIISLDAANETITLNTNTFIQTAYFPDYLVYLNYNTYKYGKPLRLIYEFNEQINGWSMSYKSLTGTISFIAGSWKLTIMHAATLIAEYRCLLGINKPEGNFTSVTKPSCYPSTLSFRSNYITDNPLDLNVDNENIIATGMEHTFYLDGFSITVIDTTDLKQSKPIHYVAPRLFNRKSYRYASTGLPIYAVFDTDYMTDYVAGEEFCLRCGTSTLNMYYDSFSTQEVPWFDVNYYCKIKNQFPLEGFLPNPLTVVAHEYLESSVLEEGQYWCNNLYSQNGWYSYCNTNNKKYIQDPEGGVTTIECTPHFNSLYEHATKTLIQNEAGTIELDGSIMFKNLGDPLLTTGLFINVVENIGVGRLHRVHMFYTVDDPQDWSWQNMVPATSAYAYNDWTPPPDPPIYFRLGIVFTPNFVYPGNLYESATVLSQSRLANKRDYMVSSTDEYWTQYITDYIHDSNMYIPFVLIKGMFVGSMLARTTPVIFTHPFYSNVNSDEYNTLSSLLFTRVTRYADIQCEHGKLLTTRYIPPLKCTAPEAATYTFDINGTITELNSEVKTGMRYRESGSNYVVKAGDPSLYLAKSMWIVPADNFYEGTFTSTLVEDNYRILTDWAANFVYTESAYLNVYYTDGTYTERIPIIKHTATELFVESSLVIWEESLAYEIHVFYELEESLGSITEHRNSLEGIVLNTGADWIECVPFILLNVEAGDSVVVDGITYTILKLAGNRVFTTIDMLPIPTPLKSTFQIQRVTSNLSETFVFDYTFENLIWGHNQLHLFWPSTWTNHPPLSLNLDYQVKTCSNLILPTLYGCAELNRSTIKYLPTLTVPSIDINPRYTLADNTQIGVHNPNVVDTDIYENSEQVWKLLRTIPYEDEHLTHTFGTELATSYRAKEFYLRNLTTNAVREMTQPSTIDPTQDDFFYIISDIQGVTGLGYKDGVELEDAGPPPVYFWSDLVRPAFVTNFGGSLVYTTITDGDNHSGRRSGSFCRMIYGAPSSIAIGAFTYVDFIGNRTGGIFAVSITGSTYSGYKENLTNQNMFADLFDGWTVFYTPTVYYYDTQFAYICSWPGDDPVNTRELYRYNYLSNSLTLLPTSIPIFDLVGGYNNEYLILTSHDKPTKFLIYDILDGSTTEFKDQCPLGTLITNKE